MGTNLGIDVCDLFNGTALAGPPVLCADDATISSLTEFLDELVLRVDDERRVQSLKRVALHDRKRLLQLARVFGDSS